MHIQCRYCFSSDVHRSGPRVYDFVPLLFLLRPVRCYACSRRQFRPLWLTGRKSGLKETKDRGLQPG
jgi:hypothetical protein